MNTKSRDDVIWFYNNLNSYVLDLKLKERGVEIATYFDTSIIRNAVLGMDALYDDFNKLNKKKFNHINTLVNCLASSGWLKEILILPPHQAEFLTLMNIEFGILETKNIEDKIHDFLIEANIYDELYGEKITIEKLSNSELTDFVKKQAGKATTFFKAIQSIRYGDWRSRLLHIKEKKIVKIDYQKFNFKNIIGTEILPIIKNILDQVREGLTTNNFADAVAIKILIDFLDDFKKGYANIFPIFFDSTGLFYNVIRKAGLEESLSIVGPEGKKINVLRNADYFVFKCSFNPQNYENNTPPQKGNFSWTYENLISLRDKLHEVIRTKDYMSLEIMGETSFFGKPLFKIIEELKKFTFLENVWLKYLAEQEITEILKDIALITLDEKFKKKVDELISETQITLENNVREYKWIAYLWKKFESSSENLRKQIGSEYIKTLDVFRDFALMRFDFDVASTKIINETFQSLISDIDIVRKDVINKIINMICDIFLDYSEDKLSYLSVVLALLWTCEIDPTLIRIVNKIKKIHHYSIRIVYAAAIFRQRKKIDKGKKELNRLLLEFEATRKLKKKANIAVGIAYLFFHLWQSKGYRPKWRYHKENNHEYNEKEFKSLIENAMKYAIHAYKILPENTIKKVYALNQYVYYVVEGGTDKQFNERHQFAQELANYKQNFELWSFRYDDTLARYFHRCAKLASNQEKQKINYQSALDHITDAERRSFGDPEVKSYKTELCVEMAPNNTQDTT